MSGGEHTYARKSRELKAMLDNVFIFSFIRNPWDWEWSKYCHAMAKPAYKKPDAWTFAQYIKWRKEHIELQSDFLEIRGKIVADWLGRFENLQADWEWVCNKIGLPHKKLPHLRKIKKLHYTEAYDSLTKNAVLEIHKKDIERWEYSFE